MSSSTTARFALFMIDQIKICEEMDRQKFLRYFQISVDYPHCLVVAGAAGAGAAVVMHCAL